MTGQLVLNRLLDTGAFDPVVAILRKPMHRNHPRLREKVVQFDSLDALAPLPVSSAICCLGTTIRKAGSREAFQTVDFGYAVAFARWARQNGARHFLYLSSVMANPSSGTFYLRVKGQTEEELSSLGFERLDIFQPSFLLGQRAEPRTGERVGQALFWCLEWAMAGPLERFRGIPAATVAKAMAARCSRPQGEPGIRRFEWREITELAQG